MAINLATQALWTQTPFERDYQMQTCMLCCFYIHTADDSQLIIIGLGGSLGKNAVLLLWTLHAWNYTSFKVYHGKISFSPFYVPVLCSRCPDRWQVGGQAWDTDQQPPWWPFHCPLVTMVTCSHSNSIFIGSPWLLRSIAALPSSSCCGSHES